MVEALRQVACMVFVEFLKRSVGVAAVFCLSGSLVGLLLGLDD
jgi:hypothetical protein